VVEKRGEESRKRREDVPGACWGVVQMRVPGPWKMGITSTVSKRILHELCEVPVEVHVHVRV
jgi:hypothetical protein